MNAFTASDMTRPFWDGCREHQLRLPRCNDCGRWFFAPEIACIHCFSQNWQWLDSPGRGSLYSYSVVHRAPVPGHPVPFVFAVIELDEGVSLFSNLVQCDFDAIAIGMRVEVVFEDGPDGRTLPRFKPGR